MKNISCKKGEAILLTDRLTRKYLCELDVAEGSLIITDTFTVFTDARYFSAAKVVLNKAGIDAVLFKDISTISDFIKDKKITKLFIDYSKTTVKEFFEYKRFGVEIDDCEGKLSDIKACKTDEEIACIKKACAIAEKAYHTAIKTVKKGITENELRTRLEALMMEYGAEDVSFETIVAFGSNAAVPHHVTGETVLTDNVPILVDMGCKVKGYCSDVTRTAFFGTPSKEFLDCYKAVLKANELAIEKITDGTYTDEADGFARDVLSKAGLGEYFTHSLGHGVGLEIHEYPTLSSRRKDVLKNNMVFTIEPGVYIDGKFGIRIEDTVLLNEGKVERLYSDDKNLVIL